MAKRKKVQAPDEKQNIMKKIVKEELERRGRTKGEDTRSVSALSGISHTNTETLAKTDDIWGAAAGAKRNIEAEARRYRQQEKVRQENIQKTQAQMQQEHSKQWKDLDIKQQQELGKLEQSQQIEVDQIKLEHTKAREVLASVQSIERQERKVEHKAQLAEKRTTFQKKKKQAWNTHLNKEDIQNIKKQQLAQIEEVTQKHQNAREQIKQEIIENISELEAQQDTEQKELMNAQEQELVKLRPEPGKPISEQQEKLIAQIEEKHKMQLAELKARHAEHKSEVRSNYIFKRNELMEEQNSEMAEIKFANRQQLREVSKPQQVLQEVNRANSQDLQIFLAEYKNFLTNQSTAAIELKVAQLETINTTITQHYRAKTEMLKNHEHQRIELSQSQAAERHALGYSTQDPITIPTVKPGGNHDPDEESDDTSSFGMR